jgi:sugar phosphate isomerase/epimerase
MHICLNRATAGAGLPLEQFVEIAANAGFPGADVDLSYAVTHGVAALQDLYASHKLRFGAWGIPFNWRSEQINLEESLAKLSAFAKIAAQLALDCCSTHIASSSKLPFLENWQFHVSRLRPCAQRLAEHGLRLGLEFLGPYEFRKLARHEFISTPGVMLELADAIGPNVGLLVDSFHAHTSNTPWEYFAALPAARIVLAHLNDAPDVPLHQQKDGRRLLPGEGILDLNAFMNALRTAGYDGPVSVEVFSDELRAMDPAEAARRAWAATARALPAYAS